MKNEKTYNVKLDGELLFRMRLLENRTLIHPRDIIKQALEEYFEMIDLQKVCYFPMKKRERGR